MALSKPVKIIGIVFVVLVVLVVGIIGTLYAMFPPAKLKAMALPQVEKILGRKTDIGSIGISLYPQIGVKIKALTIANTTRGGFDSEVPFVKLGEFVAAVKIMPLFKKQLAISKIIIRKPEILVETDSAGSFNFSDLAVLAKDTTKKEEPQKTGGPMLPVPMTLEQFTIENGTIVYNDRKGKMRLDLGAINQTVAFDIDKELKDVKTNGKLVISNISYSSKDIKKPLTGLTITLSHDLLVNVVEGLLTIKDLRASLQKIYVGVNGTVGNFNKTPVLDLNVKTDKINLADLIAEIPSSIYKDIAKIRATGNAEIALTVKGEVAKAGSPKIDGRLLLENVFVKYADLPKAINSINANIGFTGNSLNISSLNLKLGDDPISLKGTVDNFSKPLIDLALLANVNLGNLKDIVPMPKDNSLSGMVKADIKAKGLVDAANPQNLNLAGKLDLSQVTAITPAITKPVTANGVVNFTSTKISPDLNTAIGNSSFNLKAEFTNYLTMVLPDSTKKQPRPKLVFTLNSPYLNTNEFLKKEEQPAEKPAASAPQAKKAPEPLLAGTIPGIDVSGTITTTKVIYETAELNNLSMKVTQLNDVADLVVRSRLMEGTFANDFHLDMRNVRDLKIKSILAIDNVESSKLISNFKWLIPSDIPLAQQVKGLDKHLFGKITVKSDLVSHGMTLDDVLNQANGTIQTTLRNGRIAGGPIVDGVAGVVKNIPVVNKYVQLNDMTFNEMHINARVQNGRIYFDEPQKIATKALGDWEFTGAVGFDANLSTNIATRLPKNLSAPILSAQSTVVGAGKNILKEVAKSTGISQATQAVDAFDPSAIKADNEGRVTLLMGLDGPVTKLKGSFRGFGKGSAVATQATAPQQSVKQQVIQAVDQKKQELEQELSKQKQVAQEKIDQEKKAAELEMQKKANELKNTAQKKLKGLF